MKIHLGSGSVYLSDYVNLDVPGPKTFLAADRPDLVERWQTTDDAYYSRHQDKTLDTFRAGPLDQEYVCDAHGDWLNIPGANWSVDEVLARQSFEHLSISEAHKALDQVDGILKPNGILRLDVPDHEVTLQKFQETGDEFYIRHLLGPRNGDHGYHMMSYTRERLRALVEEHGFVFDGEEENIHLYPAFCLRFKKPGPRAPWEYVPLPDIPADWKVLDVGPGMYPHPRADVYLDCDEPNVARLRAKGKTVIHGDLMGGLPDIANNAFDFVWASHVLEHVPDPHKCASTLTRIGKRGIVVMPSAMKEGMFAHEETDHKWLVLPSSCECGSPIFVRHNAEQIDKLRDSELQKIASRLWRTGPNRIEEARYLRQWFYRNEAALDVVHRWEGELKLRVIE